MCGIAGVLKLDGAPVDGALLERMRDAAAHRGPDDRGLWTFGPVGLAHRRLSILDTSAAAHQPFVDGDVVVTYNGELYNFPALRAALEKQGAAFRTRTDTELLPHLWRAHGPEMVHHLRGMFAFALWDARARTLFLARDRFGQKPLYYAALADRFLFASELKSIVEDPAFPRVVDRAALGGYFAFGYVRDDASIYGAARKLAPGCSLLVKDGAVAAPRRYWALAFAADNAPSDAEWEERIEAKLEETVRCHMLSDVPVGAFLSGGVDSSTVCALMERAGAPPRTFTIGFEEAEFSELEHARAVAEHLGTRHVAQVVRPDVTGLIERLATVYDEPFADSSNIPTYLVSELARREVTVALSGDGGDELFGGYPRYTLALARQSPLPGPLRAMLAPLASRWFRRGGNLLRRLASRDANYVESSLALFGRRLGAWALLDPEPARDALLAVERELDGRRRPLADALQLTDIATYLPGDILVKVDRASMAVSLETRAPLLDHELAELVAKLPARLRADARDGKVLLKRIARRLVPPPVIDRKKMGFGVPLTHWFRRELRAFVRDALLAPDARTRGLYRSGAVEQVLAEHDAGTVDRSGSIYLMLMLELFWRRWSPS